jgi:hypothetical protein
VERSALLSQISELGDFQPGSITSAVRRCVKSGCHCAKPNSPGHGPHSQLTQKINGKIVTQNLLSPADARKAESAVAEFRRFRSLSAALLEVNRKICRLRPVEETLLPERKTAGAIRREVARKVGLLLRVIFADARKTGRLDLEAVEMAVRSALHRAGSRSSH